MGCDTEGMVLTNDKDVRKVVKAIGEVIKGIERDPDTYPTHYRPKYQRVNPKYVWDSDFMTFNFYDGKDKRILWVFLDCDSDCDEFEGGKIFLSFGCWGNSVELMKKFLTALSGLGDCYLDENDCDDKGWEKIV